MIMSISASDSVGSGTHDHETDRSVRLTAMDRLGFHDRESLSVGFQGGQLLMIMVDSHAMDRQTRALFDAQLLNRRSEHQTEPGTEKAGERRTYDIAEPFEQ